ncbi:MAG: hypothetical protein Q8900_01705 [Bacillota bacterium]|nr:hypothetical protein [Bacillota bacterium]
MKKLFGWFSLTTILVIGIYVIVKITSLPIDYTETSNNIMNGIIKGQNLQIFNFRVYDYFCGLMLFILTAIGIKSILNNKK